MLMHAPWAGPDTVVGATVLDAFAGSGALGLEALSRGARHATFIENAPGALAALRANIATMKASATVLAIDCLVPPRSAEPVELVFLDPPYRRTLVPVALDALKTSGWIGAGTLIVVETGRDEPEPPESLAAREHGAARVTFLRVPRE